MLADEGREEALSSGGLDLIIFPGLGFTKVSLYIAWLLVPIYCKFFWLLTGRAQNRLGNGELIIRNSFEC
jgi:hypothetical protein